MIIPHWLGTAPSLTSRLSAFTNAMRTGTYRDDTGGRDKITLQPCTSCIVPSHTSCVLAHTGTIQLGDTYSAVYGTLTRESPWAFTSAISLAHAGTWDNIGREDYNPSALYLMSLHKRHAHWHILERYRWIRLQLFGPVPSVPSQTACALAHWHILERYRWGRLQFFGPVQHPHSQVVRSLHRGFIIQRGHEHTRTGN